CRAGSTATPTQALSSTIPYRRQRINAGRWERANRTFDHTFGTYTPSPGQTVANLVSKEIIDQDGAPGPPFAQSQQFQVPPPPGPLFHQCGPQRQNAVYVDGNQS